MNWKLKHPLVNGILKKISKNIFAIKIKNNYDRAMLFCRYQEFYESPYKQFRNKFFTISEYMKFYIKQTKTDTFGYSNDWVGYNIPSESLEKAFDKFLYQKYMTQYDEIMYDIYFRCLTDSFKDNNTRQKFYLIGVENFSNGLFKHELSHGLYYTNNQYKKNCNDLISKIKKRDYNFIKKKLLGLGYSNDENIIKDEIQAYLSTGLHDNFDGDEIREYQEPFVKNFKKYSGK